MTGIPTVRIIRFFNWAKLYYSDFKTKKEVKKCTIEDPDIDVPFEARGSRYCIRKKIDNFDSRALEEGVKVTWEDQLCSSLINSLK